MDESRWLIDFSNVTAPMRAWILDSAVRVRRFELYPNLAGVTLEGKALRLVRENRDVKLFPDPQLKPFAEADTRLGPAFLKLFKKNSGIAGKGLNEVLEDIRAPEAWRKATGKGTFIAIIDSGIEGSHLEFPDWKRADGHCFFDDGQNPWIDVLGHGTMCAAIAAGAPEAGARLSGVAPQAKLYACRTNYVISEIIAALEWVRLKRRKNGEPIVVSNSWGFESTTPPVEQGMAIGSDHPLAQAIRDTVGDGIPVVFAAGNNHDQSKCTGGACSPDTIWAWNSMEEVITAGELDESHGARRFSSRGPGQWSRQGVTKPDCAAPAFGWILFGDSYKEADEGWGTSGAAPQVAGLLALLLEQCPNETPRRLYERVVTHCRSLSECKRCVGHGMIDCAATLY